MGRGLTWTLCLAPRRSQDGRTALHVAVLNGKVECVKVLVEAGANKEATNNNGETPLHRAAYSVKEECVKVSEGAGGGGRQQRGHK